MTTVGVFLGLVGGFAAVLLFKLIGLITHVTLLHDVATGLPSLRHFHPGPVLLLVTVGGAVIVSLMALWSPVIRGHGIPESLEAILTRDSRIRPRAAVAKPMSAAVCIGTGGPFGAEGPIIVTGGSVGSLAGQVLSVSPAERKILLATGAAAGMSATFNAPLAAVVLAVELLLFERSIRSIVPVATASAVAAAVRVWAMGTHPLFDVQGHLTVSLPHLPLFVAVGALAGLLAVVLDKGLFAVEAGFRALPVRAFWWPIIGAVGYGVIGLFVPRTLSMGYSAIVDTLNGHFAIGMLGVLFIAKLVSWWLALGSQTSGGTLAPMFLIGATMGAVFGDGLSDLVPGLHVSPGAFALVAMGAAFGAAAKAPFTAVIFCAEVTGQYAMIPPLIVGVVAAELVAGPFFQDRAMTEKLFHRGLRVDFEMWTGVLHQRTVRQTMSEPPCVLTASDALSDARRHLAESGSELAAVILDDGRYAGLLRASACDTTIGRSATVADALTTGTGPLEPQDFLDHAQIRLIGAAMDGLPVVADGRLLGWLRRADVDATLLERRESETIQPGLVRSLLEHRASRPPSPARVFRRQFREAASLLADDELTARADGVRAMSSLADLRLAADDLDGAQRCLDELCDCLPVTADGTTRGTGIDDEKVCHALTAAIAAHLRPGSRPTWSGLDLHLAGIRFTGSHSFDGAVFSGGLIDFRNAAFPDGRIGFDRSVFSGATVDFSGAEFCGGQVTFDGAMFADGSLMFGGATFSDGQISFDFAEFSGTLVDFNGGVRLSGPQIEFSGAVEFTGGQVSFLGARFNDGQTTFDRAEISGGEIAFEDAEFSGGLVSFDGTVFGADKVSFRGAAFHRGGRVTFRDARFPGGGQVSFESATFTAPVPGPWPGHTPPESWPPHSSPDLEVSER